MTSIPHSSTSIILRVPTLNDRRTDCTRLFSLYKKVPFLEKQEVIIDFSNCRFLRHNAVAFLGGLARLVQFYGGRVNFVWDTLQEDIRANLTQNGFIGTFDGSQREGSGNSIPYREYQNEDMGAIAAYLENDWLRPGWVQVSSNSNDEITLNALEIYSNVFEHSESEIGVFTCGQRYPNRSELCLTVSDFGVGIPTKVRQFLNQPQHPANKALQWAFQPGNTTRAGRVSGGTGLDTLKNFVKAKQGEIEIYSNDGYALISSTQEVYKNSFTPFEGTLINIRIRCDLPALQCNELEINF